MRTLKIIYLDIRRVCPLPSHAAVKLGNDLRRSIGKEILAELYSR